MLLGTDGDSPKFVSILNHQQLVVGELFDVAGRTSGKGEERQTAGEVMTSPLITIDSDAPVEDALEMATEQRIRHLPVVDAQGVLVGLVTQSNLLHALSD